jgi:ADP-ribose pyrophosphatase YjhB (NUDIX family)
MRVRVAEDVDVAAAARAARELAESCGLSGVEAQHVATAVSEVARCARGRWTCAATTSSC